MNKIKILFISHRSGMAGAEKCLLTLITSFNRSAVDPVVVLPGPGDLASKLRDSNVKIHFVPLEWWVTVETDHGLIGSRLRNRVELLRKVIRQERPDVIHSNSSVIWEGAIAAAFEGIPHVWHLHEKLDQHPSLHSIFPIPLVYSIIGFLSATIVTVSDAVKSEVVRYVSDRKVRIINNGIDEVKCNQSIRALDRKGLGIPESAIVVVTVGSLIKEKGHDVLIEAAGLVSQLGASLYFVIVGDGSPESVDALLHEIEENNVSDKVKYIGYRNDVHQILSECNIFALSSRSEAFPTVILEAMSLGLPVITTDCGGPREMIVDGESGFIVPVNDPKVLAEKLICLSSDETLMKTFGEKGRSLFRKTFTSAIYTQNFTDVYESVLSKTTESVSLVRTANDFLVVLMSLYEKMQHKRTIRALLLNAFKRIKRLFMGKF